MGLCEEDGISQPDVFPSFQVPRTFSSSQGRRRNDKLNEGGRGRKRDPAGLELPRPKGCWKRRVSAWDAAGQPQGHTSAEEGRQREGHRIISAFKRDFYISSS